MLGYVEEEFAPMIKRRQLDLPVDVVEALSDGYREQVLSVGRLADSFLQNWGEPPSEAS